MTDSINSSMQRIQLIEGSLRSFTLSWFSLIPFVGLAFALFTLDSCSTVRTQLGEGWNPAQRYLIAAYWLAWGGIVLSLLSLALCGTLLLKYYQLA